MVEPDQSHASAYVKHGWVTGVTFGTAGRHDQWGVVSAQLPHANVTDVSSDLGENTRDESFQSLFLVATRLVFELAHLRLLDQLLAVRIGSFDHLVFLL